MNCRGTNRINCEVPYITKVKKIKIIYICQRGKRTSSESNLSLVLLLSFSWNCRVNQFVKKKNSQFVPSKLRAFAAAGTTRRPLPMKNTNKTMSWTTWAASSRATERRVTGEDIGWGEQDRPVGGRGLHLFISHTNRHLKASFGRSVNFPRGDTPEFFQGRYTRVGGLG